MTDGHAGRVSGPSPDAVATLRGRCHVFVSPIAARDGPRGCRPVIVPIAGRYGVWAGLIAARCTTILMTTRPDMRSTRWKNLWNLDARGLSSSAPALADCPRPRRSPARAFDVTVIDRHNYHLFQPLLYQVATAGLSPADIAAPIRGILRGQKQYHRGSGRRSPASMSRNREVVAEGRRIPFDYLVLATGAQHAYFGHDDWAPYAPGLKTIDDATYLRRRILLAFERAEAEPDPAERQRLLTFVVVGAGPTGVEMAGAIAELANRALAMRFPSHRSALGPGGAGRGRPAAAGAVRSIALCARAGLAAAPRRRGAAGYGRNRLQLRRGFSRR